MNDGIDNHREHHRDKRSNNHSGDKRDVIIIGGGVVGTACAVELARQGASVTILEKDQVGQGCSYGNAGWLTHSQAVPLAAPGLIWKAAHWMFDPESPLYIPFRLDPALISWLFNFLLATRRERFERGTAALVEMCRWSVDAWEEFAIHTGDTFDYGRKGLLAIYESPASLAAGRQRAALVAKFGAPSEVWSAEKVRELELAVVGPQVGGILYPDDAQCEPFMAVEAVAAEAQRLKVKIVERCEVTDFERTNGKVSSVVTSRGKFTANEVVLAAGTWSKALARKTGIRIPMLGARGYSVVMPHPQVTPSRSILLADRKIAVTPHEARLRIAGTLELVDDDFSINQRRVNAIVRGAQKMLTIPSPLREHEVWCGLRPCTPDGMPVIGRAKGYRNLWLATGHQMVGLKAAPGTARLLVDLMTGAKPTFDPAPFTAERY